MSRYVSSICILAALITYCFPMHCSPTVAELVACKAALMDLITTTNCAPILVCTRPIIFY